jgi:hypothetical protein
MVKTVAVVGAGINGLLAAFLITENYPDLHVNVYDADKHPSNTTDHKSVTHGSKDARHITGSESIGFESSIHKDALRNHPKHDTAGWLLKDDGELTPKELQWRRMFETTYAGSGVLNDLDFAHAELNYKGLMAWNELAKKYPFIGSHIITNDGVDVYFQDQTAFEDDLAMETEFCRRYFRSEQVQAAQNETFASLYSKKLVVPGITIRVKSLAIDLLNRLEGSKKVRFHWEETVKSAAQLQDDVVIWTSGITHVQPVEYQTHGVQGIVGCWVTIPNQGYAKPFKIAASAPSAYINFTPDNNDLHISGGFGWTGEYTDISTVRTIAKPVAEHFVEQINHYLGTNIATEDVDYCVRASTPTGQPLLLTKYNHEKVNIYVTGSAKSGTTHAPILSEYALNSLKEQFI